ncbi:uncharacterized protein BDV17DRAFT_290237 [Aspergillus undulatus]|uniref:uncharacterized protein n=1 Tax=Aspergillus undulatus TaxID=1810928 RepID=UPI003CCE1BED
MVPQPIRLIIDNLQAFPKKTWGFTIYRTTYTTVSQQRFPRIIDTINTYIRRGISKEHLDWLTRAPHRAPYDMIYSATARSSGITAIYTTTSHCQPSAHTLEAWAEKQDLQSGLPSDKRVYLVRKKRLKIVAIGLLETRNRRYMDLKNEEKWWIKAPELEETIDDYDGTMRALVLASWTLAQDTYDPEPLAFQWGEDGLYMG